MKVIDIFKLNNSNILIVEIEPTDKATDRLDTFKIDNNIFTSNYVRCSPRIFNRMSIYVNEEVNNNLIGKQVEQIWFIKIELCDKYDIYLR